jgi:ketopantoate hydroxymethyltransferase
MTLIGSRHDPHVLHGASFEHAGCMDLSLEALPGDVHTAIATDVQIPTSAEPAVHVI